MRLGLSSYTFPWAVGVPGNLPSEPVTAVQLLERASAWGISVVQFADNLPLHRKASEELLLIEVAAANGGIAIELGTRGIGAHILEYLRLAVRFHAPFVRLVIDTAVDEPSLADTVQRLSTFEEHFRAAEVRLAIENHDRFTTGELTAIVQQLGDWTGVCLDTVNSFGALEMPESVVGTLAPYTLNLHIKDFTVRRLDHLMGFEVTGTPAGAGMLDIPRITKELATRGVASGILELWTPPEPTIDATIRKELQWARESVAYLRRLPTLNSPR